MESYDEQFSRIKELLKGNPMGMTVSEIAEALNLNRKTIANYLEMMEFSGHLEMKMFGAAKAYFLSKRIPLSTLLNFTSDQILVLDGNFTIVQTNEPDLGIWNFTKEDLLGKQIQDSPLSFCADKEILAAIKAALGGAQATKEIKATLNGEELYLRMKIIPTLFENNQQGITIICEDITTQMNAALTMRESEQRLQVLAESAMIGLAILQNNQIKYANKVLSSISGYSREEMLQWSSSEILNTVHPDDREQAMKQFQALQSGETDTIPRSRYRQITKEKEIKWLEIFARSILYKNHPAIIIAFVDITDQKQGKGELQRQRELMQKYLNIIGDIVVALNEKGEIILVNEKACLILEYDKKELIGKNWFDICVPLHQRKEILATFKLLMSGSLNLVEHVENLIVTKSGKGKLISWRNTVLTDEEGKIVGTLSAGEDITEETKEKDLSKISN